MFAFVLALGARTGRKAIASEPVDEVRPLIGSTANGNTYPGATVPFGFVQLSPDTRVGKGSYSGYNYVDSTVLGFSHTHLSGTGCADLGDVLILPVTGALNQPGQYVPLDTQRFRSEFSHDRERAVPGYYRVRLDKYGVLAELTATAHAGMHRYTFPASERSHVILDLVHGIGSTPIKAELKIESETRISGYRRSSGWSNGKTIYFVMECSRPFKGFGLELDGKPLPDGQSEAEGKEVRGHLDFKTSAGEQIIFRIGLSPDSVEAARNNLRAEIASWDFGKVRESAQSLWNHALSSIQIESPHPNFRQTFYTALYHVMIAPTLYNDADGTYRGADQQVHTNAGFQNYSTFSLWDTFRAEHPLLTIIQPGRVSDFVQSLLAFYRQSPDHVLPKWTLACHDTRCMIGYHAVSVIAEAYAKGFRDYDTELAYEAMRATAMSSRNFQDEYRKLGYVPAENGRKNNATARTLEFAYDDWCIAQMAKALGKTNDAALFASRAMNYTNVFDPATGFFRGRTAEGPFREPFDPKAFSWVDYIEANAWVYSFFVPQDVPGMIRLYGGREAFIHKLDELFDQDSDVHGVQWDDLGLIGQYAHGNEPSHHIPYLYALAGAQYKTAERVRQIMLREYDNTPAGLCGSDDCGEMSAWYVFSAIGLYPVNPASGIYVIGSPQSQKTVIRLDPKFYPGGTFTIIAPKASRYYCYIKSAELNGKPLNRPWISHDEIVKGGTLELEMSVLPHKTALSQINGE